MHIKLSHYIRNTWNAFIDIEIHHQRFDFVFASKFSLNWLNAYIFAIHLHMSIFPTVHCVCARVYVCCHAKIFQRHFLNGYNPVATKKNIIVLLISQKNELFLWLPEIPWSKCILTRLVEHLFRANYNQSNSINIDVCMYLCSA